MTRTGRAARHDRHLALALTVLAIAQGGLGEARATGAFRQRDGDPSAKSDDGRR
jgi:hypothetical protein